MIFVTVGTHEQPFNRLIQKVDELKKDDLLIVEGNGSIEQIGRVAIWNDEISPCYHQNHLMSF